ncbi:MAG: hypothetical protein QM813_14520 [Verrucomicrobiota bacterium]
MGTTQPQSVNSSAGGGGKPKSKLRRFFWRFVQLTLAVVIVSLMWYAIARLIDLRVVKRLQASLQQQGEPLTLVEIAKLYPPVPEAENAANALLEIWKQESPEYWASYLDPQQSTIISRDVSLEYDPDLPYLGSEQRGFKSGQPLTPENRRAVEDFLKLRGAHLAAVRQALQRPRCRFPIEIEAGSDVKLGHLSQLKTEAEAFRIAALWAADGHDIPAAWTAIDSMVRLAGTLKSEPNDISQLVRGSILQYGMAATEEVCMRAVLTESEIKQFRELWEGIDPREILQLGLRSAAVIGLSLYDLPPQVVVGNSPGMDAKAAIKRQRLGARILGMLGVTVYDKRLMLEVIEQACTIRQLDYPEGLRRAVQLEQQTQQRLYGFPPKMISMIGMPLVQASMSRAAELEAQKRCLLTALSIEQARFGAGQVPETLANLVPTVFNELPKDPFDGQPLRYQRRPKGFIVYSIGSNLRDDGGSRNRSGSGQVVDRVFEVETRN